MADKILHQITFIETDDGFRVEIKGDKEKIRESGFGPRMAGRLFGGFGSRMGRRGRGRHRHHHGHSHGYGHGRGCYQHDEQEASDKEKQPTG